MSWNRLNKLRFVKAALGTFTWSKFHFLSVTKAQGVLAVHITGGGDSTYFLVWKFTLSKFFLDKRSVIYFLSTSSPPPRSKACKKAWSSMRLIPKRSTVPPFSVFLGLFWGENWYLPICIARLITSYVGKFRARTSLMQSGSGQCTILHFSCAPLIGLTDNNFSGSKTIMITEDWVEMMKRDQNQ